VARKRKKHEEEHENHERWLVSYADFITLLFAFFTVLYATSQTDAEKMEAVVDALNSSFDNLPTAAIRMLTPSVTANELTPTHLTNDSPNKPQILSLKRNLEGQLADTVVQIGMVNQTLTLGIPERILFAAGSAELAPESLPLLEQVGKSINNLNARIRVVGRADSSPVAADGAFKDNWSLALARGLVAMQFLESKGVPGKKLTASGRVEAGPSAEGRSITIEITADPEMGAEIQDQLRPELSVPENPPAE
jgi:chemotaxis protein MotB